MSRRREYGGKHAENHDENKPLFQNQFSYSLAFDQDALTY